MTRDPDASPRRGAPPRAGRIDREARFRDRLAWIERAEEQRRRHRRWLDLLGLGIPVLVRRIAARRGASAWDWQAGRHRLFGDPSREVQERDQPE